MQPMASLLRALALLRLPRLLALALAFEIEIASTSIVLGASAFSGETKQPRAALALVQVRATAGSSHVAPAAPAADAASPLLHGLVVSNVTEGHRLRATLLTSLFVPGASTNAHIKELFTALAMNLHNRHIENVHLLMESSGGDPCSRVPELLTELAPSRKVAGASAAKVVCVPVSKQPTYADFFRYARQKLKGLPVLLSNTDVVFDESLGLIDRNALKHGKYGYVLSVVPPPPNGAYKDAFGSECESSKRCAIGAFDGWIWGGSSWDAYIFYPPSEGSMDLAYIDHVMNIPGAENRAAYQLEKGAGMKLYNACLHVRAYHWHCMGSKMHQDSTAAWGAQFRAKDLGATNYIMPCWDCPGVRMPEGLSGSGAICQRGSTHAISRKELTRLFRVSSLVSICCPSEEDCQEEILELWRAKLLRRCKAPEDTRCIVHGSGTGYGTSTGKVTTS